MTKLVQTVTDDGIKLHGALHPADAIYNSDLSPPPKIDLILFLHGVGSNFYQSALVSRMAPIVNEAGIGLLSANTRGHDFVFSTGSGESQRWMGSACEIVGECRMDIASWFRTCQKLGFKRIALMGHSLGAVKSIYSQAIQPLGFSCLIAASPSCLSYSRFKNANQPEPFLNGLNWAESESKAGRPEQLGVVDFPFRLMMTPATYLDKYGVEENYNILKFIPRIEIPFWVGFGENEVRGTNVAFSGLDQDVKNLTASMLSATIEVIPEANHYYSGKQPELTESILKWMGRLADDQSGNEQ